MSLPRESRQKTFFETAMMMEELFPAKDRYRLFRERIMPVLWKVREELCELYDARQGRPAIEPTVMAGITVLQYMERLPDRQAAEQVRLNLGWKYALELELDHEGIHPTSLTVFRQRLVEGGKASVVFEGVLEALQDAGLVKQRNRQRLDSTHIVGNVAQMSRLEVVRESIRLALEAVDRKAYGRRPTEWAQWKERYCGSSVHYRGESVEGLKAKLAQAGTDGYGLLDWAMTQRRVVRAHEKVQLLARVLAEQFERDDADEDDVRPRRTEGAGVVKNPHDPEAEWARKSADVRSQWTGYKVQVAETVRDGDEAKPKGEPTDQFIVDVTTTTATTSDKEGLEQSLQAQAERGLEPPTEHFVDAAYVSGANLAAAQANGGELVGPMQHSPTAKDQYAVEAFEIDTEAKTAVCPAGRRSTQCSVINDRHQQRAYYRFEWGAQCDTCPQRNACTRSGSGRRMVSVGLHHMLVQARRNEATTPEFQRRMRARNGIEGTISELTRNGMRRTRYRGLAKTSLANYFHATACNVKRWLALMAHRCDEIGPQTPPRQPKGRFDRHFRPVTAPLDWYARLAAWWLGQSCCVRRLRTSFSY